METVQGLETQLLDDRFVVPKIRPLHRAQVCVKMNIKIEQRLWSSFQTIIFLMTLVFKARIKRE